jgi:hypothetical protein
MCGRSRVLVRATPFAVAIALLAAGCTEESLKSARRPSPSPSPIGTGIATGTVDARPGPVFQIEPAARRAAKKVGFDLKEEARRVHKRVLRFWPSTLPNIQIEAKPGRRSLLAAGGEARFYTGYVYIELHPEFQGDFKQQLPYDFRIVLAHELNHSARIYEGPGFGNTLLHALIGEGLAEAFALELFPKSELFSEDALAPEQERLAWAEARRHLGDFLTKKKHARWFFGKADLPNATGYGLGLSIIQSYLKHHPKEKASDITLMPSRKILRGSKYKP